MYYYVKNIQGDIVKIVSSTGTVVANYAYNAWGELLSVKDGSGNPITDQTSIAYLNPLRYRGYVYDDETGLYYLQSRYYDPVTCRFINADIYCKTKSAIPFSTNMFAYCENNPTSKADYKGTDVAWIQAEHSGMLEVGHTSLLIQTGAGWWWYFYWYQDSVQLLFLPPSSLNDVNRRVSVILSIFSAYYGINIKRTDTYTKSLVFKGNFYNSYVYAVNRIKGIQKELKRPIYTLKVNPDRISSSYDTYHYLTQRANVHQIYKYLNSYDNLHYKYNNSIREIPASMVVLNIGYMYSAIGDNCMHESIMAMLEGTYYGYTYYFSTYLNMIRAIYSEPNSAYSRMKLGYYHTAENFL